MRLFTSILTVFFGLFWLIFGLNGLFHLFPIPAPPVASAYFMEALDRAAYVMPLVYSVQVLVGLMLLLRAWVPLALLMLAPITANILLYDLMLNPKSLAIGIIIAAIHALLLWRNRTAYAPLLLHQQPGH